MNAYRFPPSTRIAIITLSILTLASCVNDVLESVDRYSIGDTGPGGGIVFYTEDWGIHGLEIMESDLSSAMAWSTNMSNLWITFPVELPPDVGTGRTNTVTIVNIEAVAVELGVPSTELSAGDVCWDYAGGGMDDWYLPSLEELRLVWTNLVDDGTGVNNGIGGFASEWYYSSSKPDWDIKNISVVSFADGSTAEHSSSSGHRVRAIRQF